MALINFSFKAPKTKALKSASKSKERKTKTKRVKKFETIEKDVESVISVTNETYVCIVNLGGIEESIPIHQDSLSTKGHSKVYRLLNGKYITHLRSSDDELRNMPDYFIPFKPGMKVKCNIVKDKDNKFIYIKKIYK